MKRLVQTDWSDATPVDEDDRDRWIRDVVRDESIRFMTSGDSLVFRSGNRVYDLVIRRRFELEEDE